MVFLGCSDQVPTDVLPYGGGGLWCPDSDCNLRLRERYACVRFVGVQRICCRVDSAGGDYEAEVVDSVLELDDVWGTEEVHADGGFVVFRVHLFGLSVLVGDHFTRVGLRVLGLAFLFVDHDVVLHVPG